MNTIGRFLFLIYFCLIGAPLFLLLTILTALTTTVGCMLGGSRIFSYYPGMLWSRCTLFLFLCPIRVRGREHIPGKGPFVVMANHQGACDLFMMYGYLGIPFKWVLKEGIRKLPFVGYACRSAGFVFVDDTRPSSIAHTMDQAKRVLAEGTSIFIFPEGSRTRNGRLARFKKGGFLMADELGVPIIPVSLDGSYRVLPSGKLIPRPHRLTLTIHPPLSVADFGERPLCISEAVRETSRRIASVLPEEMAATQSK